jgi:hypothetical protein
MRMSILLAIAIVVMFCAYATADCDLDHLMAAQCNNELQSGIRTCMSMHPNPLDADDLRRCEMYSQDVYKRCTAWLYQSPTDCFQQF